MARTVEQRENDIALGVEGHGVPGDYATDGGDGHGDGYAGVHGAGTESRGVGRPVVSHLKLADLLVHGVLGLGTFGTVKLVTLPGAMANSAASSAAACRMYK